MQLFAFFVLLLFTLAESSSVESDLLSSVDIIAFKCSLDASEHWDCPRVGDRAARAEEARVWQTVIPDARIEEIRALSEAEQYRWVSSDPLMQNRALLGMRRPDLESSTTAGKVLYSRSKQINQDALSVILSQLEPSKDRILEWMARTQMPIPSIALRVTDSLVNRHFRVPQATSYHPRAFKHPHFTTGDLVAWMALTAESRQKGQDAFKFFKLMAKSFLPSFSVSLGAVPVSSAGKPAKTVYLHRSFQYVPAGADLAFYFDGNRGKFLTRHQDSIVLNRPEGIVDGQQHAALILSSIANVDASSFKVCQTSVDIGVRRAFCGELEKAIALRVPSKATDAEVQAIGVSTIRSLASLLERDSFLEAQRKAPESKPTLLAELLPAKLVRLVIDYFSDDTYPFIVSTHRWSLKEEPMLAVDSARLYVVIKSEGIRGLSHSSASLKESERRCIELGHPHWSSYLWFTSSCDGRYFSFSHRYRVSTDVGRQAERSVKWFTQSSMAEGGRFKRVAFDGHDLLRGVLSRDGQTLLSCSGGASPTTRIYRVKEEAGKDPVAFMRLEFSGGMVRAISDKGNRIMATNREQQSEVHDISKDASKLVCQLNSSGCIGALNEDGSEAAIFNRFDELQIKKVDKVVEVSVDQPVIIPVSESLGRIVNLVYSDGNKLHVLHKGGRVSLFDPSTKEFILLEVPQREQEIIKTVISPNADYIAILQWIGKEKESKESIYRTTVKRKLESADWRNLFGYEIDKAAGNKQAQSPSEEQQ